MTGIWIVLVTYCVLRSMRQALEQIEINEKKTRNGNGNNR
jgi:hypothetical protein